MQVFSLILLGFDEVGDMDLISIYPFGGYSSISGCPLNVNR